MNLTDQQIKRVLKGRRLNKREAQKELYRNYFGYAMSVAFQHCSDYDIAVALTNDAFLKVYGDLKNILPQTGNTADSFKIMLGNSVFDEYMKHKSKYHTRETTAGEDTGQVLNSERYKAAAYKLPYKEAV